MGRERPVAKVVFLALLIVATGGWLYFLTKSTVALIQMIK
jgi:hypothetical protein